MRFQRLWRPAIPLNDLTGGQWGDGSCRSAGTEAQVVEREGALEMTLSSLFILKMTRGAQRGKGTALWSHSWEWRVAGQSDALFPSCSLYSHTLGHPSWCRFLVPTVLK